MLSKIRKTLLWSLWFILASIYVTTVVADALTGNILGVALALLNLACCVLLYFAEGFEIAFAMLWSRKESTDPKVQSALENLDVEQVLAERQIVVVAVISFVSLMTQFHSIVVPFYGRVSSPVLCGIFTFLLVTLTILWATQILPKRLAAKAPEQFFAYSKWLLRPIALSGRLVNLPAPSDDLVSLFERIAGRSRAEAVIEHPSTAVAQLWAECDCEICSPITNVWPLSPAQT